MLLQQRITIAERDGRRKTQGHHALEIVNKAPPAPPVERRIGHQSQQCSCNILRSGQTTHRRLRRDRRRRGDDERTGKRTNPSDNAASFVGAAAARGANAPGRKDGREEKRRGSASSLEGARSGLYSPVGGDDEAAWEQRKSGARGPLSPNRQGPYHKGQADDHARQAVADGRRTVQWEPFLAPR